MSFWGSSRGLAIARQSFGEIADRRLRERELARDAARQADADQRAKELHALTLSRAGAEEGLAGQLRAEFPKRGDMLASLALAGDVPTAMTGAREILGKRQERKLVKGREESFKHGVTGREFKVGRGMVDLSPDDRAAALVKAGATTGQALERAFPKQDMTTDQENAAAMGMTLKEFYQFKDSMDEPRPEKSVEDEARERLGVRDALVKERSLDQFGFPFSHIESIRDDVGAAMKMREDDEPDKADKLTKRQFEIENEARLDDMADLVAKYGESIMGTPVYAMLKRLNGNAFAEAYARASSFGKAKDFSDIGNLKGK